MAGEKNILSLRFNQDQGNYYSYCYFLKSLTTRMNLFLIKINCLIKFNIFFIWKLKILKLKYLYFIRNINIYKTQKQNKIVKQKFILFVLII